jgi:hypothetical protein
MGLGIARSLPRDVEREVVVFPIGDRVEVRVGELLEAHATAFGGVARIRSSQLNPARPWVLVAT